MTEVVQLEQARLARLFDDSLANTVPRLPPGTSGTALRMLRAGADVAQVAERLQVSVGALLPCKDYLERVAREKAEREAQREARAAAAREEAARLRRQTPTIEEHRQEPPACAPPGPAAGPGSMQTSPPESADSLPDVDLNLLQRGAIRLLRKGGTSLETIAKAFRAPVRQVRAICREPEASP